MIHGVGTDIVEIARMRGALQRHGVRFAQRILGESEREAFASSPMPERFLSKRFAAKEAFGKALGTGVVAPATLHAVTVDHDARGKPLLRFGPELQAYMQIHGLSAHLSLSDESEYVVAFALIERHPKA